MSLDVLLIAHAYIIPLFLIHVKVNTHIKKVKISDKNIKEKQ